MQIKPEPANEPMKAPEKKTADGQVPCEQPDLSVHRLQKKNPPAAQPAS